MANSNVYTLSTYDEKLSNKAKEGIRSAKADFARAQKIGDTVGMAKANAQANRIRKQYGGYTGGSDGSGYYPVSVPGNNSRDEYKSAYTKKADRAMTDIVNRKEFSFDLDSDPMYKLYKKVYTKAGNDAFDRAYANGVLRTGGNTNTNAVTAATQAQSYYSALLADKATELYNNAYDRYNDSIDRDYDKLKMLTEADDTAYSRYRDAMADYESDRRFDYDMYNDEYSSIADMLSDVSDMKYQTQRDMAQDSKWQQEFDYSKERDATQSSQWQQEFDYNKERDTAKDSQWQQEFDYTKEHDAATDAREDLKIAAQIQRWQDQSKNDRFNTMAKLIQSVYNKSNIGVNINTIKNLLGL